MVAWLRCWPHLQAQTTELITPDGSVGGLRSSCGKSWEPDSQSGSSLETQHCHWPASLPGGGAAAGVGAEVGGADKPGRTCQLPLKTEAALQTHTAFLSWPSSPPPCPEKDWSAGALRVCFRRALQGHGLRPVKLQGSDGQQIGGNR